MNITHVPVPLVYANKYCRVLLLWRSHLVNTSNAKLEYGYLRHADPCRAVPAAGQIEVLEGAIERAGESPSQTMLETYARLLKLCGREPALPASVKVSTRP
jgi:adenylate kinase